MKKLLSIIALLTVCTALTACGTVIENNGETESRVIEKRNPANYKMGELPLDCFRVSLDNINTFEDLEAQSELIVIGEFTDNSKPCFLQYELNGFNRIDNLARETSFCPMKITRVLAGDAQVGDVINVLQDEWYSKDRFYTRSDLTPMQMGDEWVFCLKHAVDESYGDGYWCAGDSKGRYPTKNSGSNEKVCFSDYPELGVYREDDFHDELYNGLLEKYGDF